MRTDSVRLNPACNKRGGLIGCLEKTDAPAVVKGIDA